MAVVADAVSGILGVQALGALPLISALEHGLPLAALDRLSHAVAPADASFPFRIVARATLARRRKASAAARPDGGKRRDEGRLSAEEGTRLARLASVWTMALEVWGNAEDARRFMFEGHMLLHGRRPVDVVLENEFGRPAVEAILGGLQYGNAV